MTAPQNVTTPPSNPARRAVLAAIQAPSVSDADRDRSLEELTRLAAGLGIEVVATVTQKRADSASTHLFGRGKLDALAAFFPQPEEDEDDEADGGRRRQPDPPDPDAPALLLVDLELNPGQQRALQKALGVPVLDRTGVILQVFEERARTRVARNEVEVARLTYAMPRLRDDTQLRQAGGGGRGGQGNTHAAMSRDRMRARIAALKAQLEVDRAVDARARARRAGVPVAAIVGYTNAGKSSLMRGLTGSEVLVADALFATLGTTVRAIEPETDPRALVCDTVGFIDNLPHGLVASFRSTLDEVSEADLLVFVVDASDPHRARQLAVTRETVETLGHAEAPALVVFNKVDRLDDEARQALAAAHPDAVLISAHDPDDVARLRLAIERALSQGLQRAVLRVPYAAGHLIGEVHSAATVLAERYDAEGTVLQVRVNPAELARLRHLGVALAPPEETPEDLPDGEAEAPETEHPA